MPNILKLTLRKTRDDIVLGKLTSVHVDPKQARNGHEYSKRYRDGLMKVMPIRRLDLVIDSQGGMTESAIGLVDALEEMEIPVRVLIEGQCWSAATLVAFSHVVGQVDISPVGSVYLHQSKLASYRRKNGIWQVAYRLGNLSTSALFAGTYAARTGKPKRLCKEWIKAGVRFTAEQAVEAGFCGRVVMRYQWERES